MYEYILLACSLFAVVLGTVIKKYYMRESVKGLTPVFLYNAITGLVSAIIIFFWGGIDKVSLFTLLLGIVFGLITTLQTITLLKAMEIGPMSYTTLINSFSTLIPTLSGALFFNEKIELVHIFGIILMIISFILSVDKSKNNDSASIKWLIYSIIAFLCTGAIGVMQKIHQSSDYKGELNAFLVLAFVVSFVFAIILTLLFSKKENNPILQKNQSGKVNYIILLVIVIAGACVAVNNKLNLYLSGVMDSAVFFPIVSGGGLVLTTISALIVFKEKLTKKQWAGIIIGILSVILLCNPFR
ncbi:MAG: DUF2304 family protein [Clostridia bacterium]|nr:DUF2304 family protein [Clostridia bacterium]